MHCHPFYTFDPFFFLQNQEETRVNKIGYIKAEFMPISNLFFIKSSNTEQKAKKVVYNTSEYTIYQKGHSGSKV